MDNQYVRGLKVQKKSAVKRLYAVICLVLVSALLLSTATYAWFVLSSAPEVTDVTTTLGANGNLEIALATSDHLAVLESNDMHETGSNFEYTTGDVVHDNVLWGNLVDLSSNDYGLNSLNMRPAILNIVDGCVADMPISVGKYGIDGRLTTLSFNEDNIDLEMIGFSSVYSTEKGGYHAGSIEMTIDDLKSGNFDKQDVIETILDNKEYGVRIAGLLDYSASAGQDSNTANLDLMVDGYCFAIDLLFRTNVASGNLMLQTEGTQRMESEMEDEYVGNGSFIEINNEKLSAATKVVFTDTLTGKLYALAQADSTGRLWITARADENGNLTATASDDAALIKPLVQNQVSAITAWVFIDAAQVDNSAMAYRYATSMKLNLQFSTDTVLNPAYTDVNTNPDYQERPDMPNYSDMSGSPNEPLDVGPVSNLHFEMVDGYMTLAYDYPDEISDTVDDVRYNISLTDEATGTSFAYRSAKNYVHLKNYTRLVPGVYNKFHVDSEYDYEVTDSAEFDTLELTVTEQDSTAEDMYVRIDPTSETSNYGYTYTLTGLTPNTPFLLYTASEKSAFGTGDGPTYSDVTVGMSDSSGNITADLSAWNTIKYLKDDPDELGAELTKLYFKIIEHTDAQISDDGLTASFTQNLRYDWTHYTPGGVGTHANQDGTLGDNLSWAYTTDGTLRISGSGAMTECESGEYPWSGLSGLVTDIIIEDGVTSVADYAFREFIRLQTVSFGDTITEIGHSAFYLCDDLQNFVLPESLELIDDCAFRDCESLTSVVIPDSVTKIGNSAFCACSGLETVTLSAQLTEIPQMAFGWCSSLEAIVIPEGVTSIGLQAFNVCTSMETITLPATLTSVASYAFDACNSLTDVYYNGSDTMWDNISIRNTGNDELTNATIHYSIADPASGTWGTNLTWEYTADRTLRISGSGEMDSSNAYTYPWSRYSGYATDLVIEDGITSTSFAAFKGFSVLESVSLGADIRTIGVQTFSYCSGLKELVLPEGLETINREAFYACESTEKIVLPSSLTFIGDSAFYLCKNLESIAIPVGVTTLERYTFRYCYSLKDVTLPEGLVSIGTYAFEGCHSLTSLVMPESVSTIGEYAFYNSRCLRAGLENGVYYVDNWAIDYEEGTTEVSLRDGTVGISASAFYKSELISIDLPSSLKHINMSAFSNCMNLQEVIIPDGVTTIPRWAFVNCRTLMSVTLPTSVMAIEDYAFCSCISLSHIYYKGSEEEWNSISINTDSYEFPESLTIHYNAE